MQSRTDLHRSGAALVCLAQTLACRPAHLLQQLVANVARVHAWRWGHLRPARKAVLSLTVCVRPSIHVHPSLCPSVSIFVCLRIQPFVSICPYNTPPYSFPETDTHVASLWSGLPRVSTWFQSISDSTDPLLSLQSEFLLTHSFIIWFRGNLHKHCDKIPQTTHSCITLSRLEQLQRGHFHTQTALFLV